MQIKQIIARVLYCATAAATLVIATAASAADYKIVVPAAPGGGWDQLGRAVQANLQATKIADRVQVNNVPGAGGTIGLAQLINNNKGDGNALMVTGKAWFRPCSSTSRRLRFPRDANRTPTGEYEVLVVPANSPLKSAADLVAAYKANPAQVSWAGGLAGGVDQLTAGMIVQAVGGELGKFNYVAFNSGGEVLAQTLGGHVTVGMGGYQEFAPQITSGKLRALAITSDKRLPESIFRRSKSKASTSSSSTGAG